MRQKKKDFSSYKNPLKLGNRLLKQKKNDKAVRKQIGKISPFNTIIWVGIFWTIHTIRENKRKIKTNWLTLYYLFSNTSIQQKILLG